MLLFSEFKEVCEARGNNDLRVAQQFCLIKNKRHFNVLLLFYKANEPTCGWILAQTAVVGFWGVGCFVGFFFYLFLGLPRSSLTPSTDQFDAVNLQ